MATGKDELWGPKQDNGTRVSTIPTLVLGAFLMLVLLAGGFALHVWTFTLFYRRWGLFWAAAFFCSPPMGEVVAVFACFWWHIWYYVLAIAVYVVSLGGFYFLQEDADLPFRPGLFAGWVCLVCILSVSFGHYAWKYSLGPTLRSAADQARLEDSALAVMACLHASASDDPCALTDLLAVKKRLTEQVRGYDKGSLDDLCAMVDQCLRYERSLQKDILGYMVDLPRTGKTSKFTIGLETKQALDQLPDKVRASLGGDPSEVVEVLMTQLGRKPSDWAEGWRKLVERMFERTWMVYGQTYSEILARPMPRPAAL
jgi:hypothetical protein